MTSIYRLGNNSSERCGRRFIGVLLGAVLLTTASYVQAATFRVEIDHMRDTDHTHRPSDTVLAAVVQMFACQGHTLVIERSTHSIPHHDVLRRDPDNCGDSLFDYDGSADSFGTLKDTYAHHSSDDGWHYCLFAHKQEDDSCTPSSSSGLGERPGWNFIVTLGGWGDNDAGTEFEQAATLAHELGHNLGLTHCGYADCGGIGNYLPILPSIMSYRYQLNGVRTNLLCKGLTIDEALFKEIDYSRGRMCSLDERNLNEPFGTAMRAVDWNCDGSFDTGVAHDINGGKTGWCNSSGTRSWVDDTNEWARISDPSRGVSPEVAEEVSCITLEEWREVQQETGVRGVCPQPTLTTEACLGGKNVYVGQVTAFPSGYCNWPWVFVQAAHDNAPPNSTFFMLPGTFDETSLQGTIVLDKPGNWFCNVGTAVIE